MRISDWSSDLCSSDLMEWASQHGDGCAWIASFPTDAPFLPRDLVARMADAVERRGADMACAASGGRAHPVIGLWPIRLKDDLSRAMRSEEHPSELQSLMRISYAVFCLKNKNTQQI